MKIYLSFIFCLLLLQYSCTVENNVKSSIGENLKKQTFKITSGIDTVLTSEYGSKIFIEKNTFPEEVKNIEIHFKEALTLAEMIKAGLTTTSDEKILSTGGMIYIIAKSGGKEVELKNPIQIQVPTQNFDPEMQLFKGEVTEKRMNWKLVGDLETNSIKQAYFKGKQIFDANCTACHKMGEILIGPDLTYVTERRDKKWLNTFTKNSMALIQAGDKIAECLHKSFNGVIMPPQDLNDDDIKKLYAYIKIFSNNSKKERQPDNCSEEKATKTISLIEGKWEANKKNESAKYQRQIDSINSAVQNANDLFAASNTYNFSVPNYGWYNCDMFLESPDNVVPNIAIQFSENKTRPDRILIVIPELKAIIPCELKNGKLTNYWAIFRFPRNKNAFVIFSKLEKKEEYYFSEPIVFNENPVTITVNKYDKSFDDIKEILN